MIYFAIEYKHRKDKRLKYEHWKIKCWSALEIKAQKEKKLNIIAYTFFKKNQSVNYIRAWSQYAKEAKEERWKDYRRKVLKDKVRVHNH